MSNELQFPSLEELREKFEQASNLTNILIKFVEEKNAPGIAVAVVIGDEIVFSKTKGKIGTLPGSAVPSNEQEEGEEEIKVEETAFLIASITKTFLAILCLQCRERGLIDLDQDINLYLDSTSSSLRYPRLVVKNPHFPENPITIRHLLTHCSGLQDDESALESDSIWRTEGYDCTISLYECVARRLVIGGDHYERRIWDHKHPPGQSQYHYSNAGFLLLGLVIEQATNMSLNDLAHRDIFQPLGMIHTDYFLSFFQQLEAQQTKLRVRVAVPHRSQDEPINHYTVAEWPACQIRSTLGDLTRYLRYFTSASTTELLLSKESRELLMPESMRQGLSWWGKDAQYGDRRGRYWSHGGFMDGVRTLICLWPEQSNSTNLLKQKRRGAVILINGSCFYEHVARAIVAGFHGLSYDE